ncbi:N-acetylmuramoyl-L-alanine amidase family protein [Peptoniphilus sp. oral taxon 386]|uniref:peptidoglycan recognition protein family protein n=1 Tax=Peptoniphilus sp. oral taxon 386 TaxID=652713 RepID=UPI0001DA9D0E|nr:peptidoglycan recognition family protein [Peptoniphilus sp. oral taxon 386]EFI42486.1 N-acetylmuramoyl-L-alanine amidase [Peptoniphilus sp. oral taxon 386 str. F0131]
MIVDKRPIKYNFSSRSMTKIIYIVVHDTGNSNKGANAINHYRYFNGGNRNASAHFFVDENGVVETVEISKAAWHCGDGHGRYGITNNNSIGIELCVNEGSDFEKTKANAIKLIRFLMESYGITKNNVVRHFDASRKLCPRSMSADNWKQWWIFKEMI